MISHEVPWEDSQHNEPSEKKEIVSIFEPIPIIKNQPDHLACIVFLQNYYNHVQNRKRCMIPIEDIMTIKLHGTRLITPTGHQGEWGY